MGADSSHRSDGESGRGRTPTRPMMDGTASASGLHHRHVNRSSSHEDTERGPTTLLPRPKQNKPRKYGNGHSRRNKNTSLGEWARVCVLAGIPAYLILMFLYLNRMNHRPVSEADEFFLDRQQYNGISAPYIRSLHATLALDHALRAGVDQEDQQLRRRMIQSSTAQRNLRRSRIQPSSLADAANHEVLKPTQILSPLEWKRPPTRFIADDDPRPALMRPALSDELCGVVAPGPGFAFADALKMPKARTTRVLLTGILTQPAYLLALALQQQCQVDVMMGFDAMYPNSIRNRWRLQEQMAVLTKFIPKLIRPIFIAHIGIDPLRHAKSFHVLEETREVDVVQSLTPTHVVHFAAHDPAVFRYHSDPEWKNTQSPYVHERSAFVRTSPVDGANRYHQPALYSIRSGLLAMEQLLAAIAAAPLNDRPHFVYATTSVPGPGADRIFHTAARRMDEVLADYYFQQHGVFSIGLRLPSALLGPWSHPESEVYQLVDHLVRNVADPSLDVPPMVEAALTSPDALDVLSVHDLVDATIAAMQYRPPLPVLLDLRSGATVSLLQVRDAVGDILAPTSRALPSLPEEPEYDGPRREAWTAIGWAPRISVAEGLTRMVAWHVDRLNPYGPPLYTRFNRTLPYTMETGDKILERHSYDTCDSTDNMCHGGRPFLPCASECSIRQKCVATAFDPLVSMVQDLTEGCDIVLYTYNFDNDATDLTLQSEYIEDNHPQICNFAFVRGNTRLVDNVIQKVPESELGRLGFELSPEDEPSSPDDLLSLKRDKLNGRLLYRGWILIWTKDEPEEFSTAELFLLKLSPGKLFHSDVKSAVFIDQGFGVSPRADDVLFLVNEMNRDPMHPRIVKRKHRPKAKFLLPPEPQRKAVILMSELKKQDAADAVRLASEEKITTYEATRFMRYSNGEEPLGKEPTEIKVQREFYDRVRATINPDTGRGPSDPIHKFELSHWIRSRWVAHDLMHEESRQLRCDWYQEQVLWEANLDQLSFAYVMQWRELDRKLEHNEPDETAQKHLSERTEMKKLLSDTFEWHSLKTSQNKLYSPFEEMQILPYDMDNTEERELLHRTVGDQADGLDIPLFVRIISDRIMAYARKAWSRAKVKEEEVDEDGS